MVIHHGLSDTTHNVFCTWGGTLCYTQIQYIGNSRMTWMHTCNGLGAFGLTSWLGRARPKPPNAVRTTVSPHLVVTPLPLNIVLVYPAQPSPVPRRYTRNSFLRCCRNTMPLSQAHRPQNVTHVHPERLMVGYDDSFFSRRPTDHNQTPRM